METATDTRIRRVPVMLVAAVFQLTCAYPAPAPVVLPSPLTSFAVIERSFDFRTVEVPGAKRTVPSGIDDEGHIVGRYDDSAGVRVDA